MRRFHRLTETTLRKAGPGLHCDGLGLYLQVSPGKHGGRNRSWLFRFAVAETVVSANGRPRQRSRDMGLGVYPDVGLAEARERAAEARRQRRDGLDPIEERRARRAKQATEAAKAMTFDACRDAYFAAHRAGWRNPKHAAQWLSTLATYATPVFGHLPVSTVDTALVMKVLTALWTSRNETAARVRGRIESVLDWARVRGYRTGENPARWRGHLDHLLPARSRVRKIGHHAALPHTEVASFMGALRQQRGVGARALEFLILCASRTGEVLGAKWSEVDFATRTWLIPGDRMKSGREHRVPLSPAAIAVLKNMKEGRTGEHVFAGAKRGGLSDLSFVLIRMGRETLTVHGFRSSFRDWCAERTNFPREVAEAALAHALKDKTEAAYQRSDLLDRRRKLMEAWAAYCSRPAATGGTVVPMTASQ